MIKGTGKLTLVPERLSHNLVTGSIRLIDVLGRPVLLDLGIVVLGVATVLVEGSHLDLFFNLGKVDRGHGI